MATQLKEASSVSDFIVAYKIVKALGKDWDEFEAYDLGLIDKKGKKLRSPETSEEKKAYSSFNKIVFNLKRIMQKVIGKNKNINKIVSAMLLKEGYDTRVANKVVSDLGLPKDTEDLLESEMALIEKFLIED